MKIITKQITAVNTEVEFKVGSNAEDNFDIIDAANPEDVWFHINARPSEHVIASIPDGLNKKQLNKIIVQGAVICKQYSKYSSEKDLEIIYTKVKNIKKTDVIGCVETSNVKTIKI
jgi:predicted ribosome quality control (RQC) complex YloA/Tae2 family protein